VRNEELVEAWRSWSGSIVKLVEWIEGGERRERMGIIEGGSASGLLPDERLFAVNFPGYPSSLARATQALGGEDRIAEVNERSGLIF
jgi:hypothetical protein